MVTKCPDCGTKLDPIISNSKAPNNHRIRLYSCEKCSLKKNAHVVVSVTKKIVPEKKLWEIIQVDIFQTK